MQFKIIDFYVIIAENQSLHHKYLFKSSMAFTICSYTDITLLQINVPTNVENFQKLLF